MIRAFLNRQKLFLFLLFFLLISAEAFCQQEGDWELRRSAVSNGIGLGAVIAVVASWERNKSILLAVIHGIFSWLYVIYFLITRKAEERK